MKTFTGQSETKQQRFLQQIRSFPHCRGPDPLKLNTMTAKDRTYLSFLLLGLFQQIQGSLVKTNLGLKVKRGQSVFLQEEDLQFHIPRAKDACKLEVVLNEPITQRVGTLTPQVTPLTSSGSLFVLSTSHSLMNMPIEFSNLTFEELECFIVLNVHL